MTEQKRIVILPTFASAHILPHFLQNTVDGLRPTHIVMNESLFPNGPENKGHVDTATFMNKWCFQDKTVGFDWAESCEIVQHFQNTYPDITFVLNEQKYTSTDANVCFLDAITNFGNIEVVEGDLIFPLEPDAFILESDSETIETALSELKCGEGLQVKWVDFLQTQYYTENVNIKAPKYRRFAYRFDNMANYRRSMGGFMSQDYSQLIRCDAFFVRHYCWFVPSVYKQLRFDLIWRNDPKYWQDFSVGLDKIQENSKNSGWLDVVIRPSRQDASRYAVYFGCEHPKSIKNHPNYV